MRCERVTVINKNSTTTDKTEIRESVSLVYQGLPMRASDTYRIEFGFIVSRGGEFAARITDLLTGNEILHNGNPGVGGCKNWWTQEQ